MTGQSGDKKLHLGMSKNTLGWADIPVTDLDRAVKFYSIVLGDEVTVRTVGDFSFGLLPHEDKDSVFGCLMVCDDNQPGKTGPLIYLSVEGRLDEAVRLVSENGGEILAEKHQIGPNGYRAIVVDSEGNRIALHSDAV